MKYAIIIPDGAADEPLPELDGKTPLQAANTPNMDRIAQTGRLGLVRTVPDGFESGSDVATMSLLGYDPSVYHTGRAPLEAAAQSIPLALTDWVFRCNLVTTRGGLMKDHSAGGISNVEARQLLVDLAEVMLDTGFEIYQGVSYRNLMVYRGGQAFDLKTKPPHEIPEEPIDKWLPSGIGSDILRRIMDTSASLFANHEINIARRQAGKNEATQVWLWGEGHPPAMPKFAERFQIAKGCMITSVDLLRGLGALLGWDVREVDGMTSFHDTNYLGQGVETAKMLDEYDLVLSHIEAPDEASHQADWKTKVEAIEAIDKHIVGPVLQKMKKYPDWRVMVLPDHPTNIRTRKHGYAPTLFAMTGSGIKPSHVAAYSEPLAAASGLKLDNGHDLMDFFLRGGGE